MKDKPSSKLTAAVNAIAGVQTAPDWLYPVVEKFSEILRGNIEYENLRPSRPEIKERLERLISKSKDILNELDEPVGNKEFAVSTMGAPAKYPLRDYLLSDEEIFLPFRIVLRDGLNLLIERCKNKLERFPKTSGGKKPLADVVGARTLDGQIKCAVMIGVTWEAFNREWPGVHNENAQMACGRVWELACDLLARTESKFQPEPEIETELEGSKWRPYLEKARNHRQGPDVTLFREIIAMHKKV